jgi:hypothetical protein
MLGCDMKFCAHGDSSDTLEKRRVIVNSCTRSRQLLLRSGIYVELVERLLIELEKVDLNHGHDMYDFDDIH